jgi:hyperosmotically inducible protein
MKNKLRFDNNLICGPVYGLLLGVIFGLIVLGCRSKIDGPPVLSPHPDPGTPRSFSTTMNDSMTLAKIKTRMISDDLVKSGPIDVDVNNGVAFLTGVVETDSQRRMAADLVRGVEGVFRVENRLTVSSP